MKSVAWSEAPEDRLIQGIRRRIVTGERVMLVPPTPARSPATLPRLGRRTRGRVDLWVPEGRQPPGAGLRLAADPGPDRLDEEDVRESVDDRDRAGLARHSGLGVEEQEQCVLAPVV
jgi:hypothetical protein